MKKIHMPATKKQKEAAQPLFDYAASQPYEIVVLGQFYEWGEMVFGGLTAYQLLWYAVKLVAVRLKYRIFGKKTYAAVVPSSPAERE